MSDHPDFLREISVRPLALVNAGCALAAFAGFVALTLAVPALRQEVVWLVGLAVAGALGLSVVAVKAGRALRRGGNYRVLIRDGRLSVASPSIDFGPDFEVALAAITRLVVTTDDGDR